MNPFHALAPAGPAGTSPVGHGALALLPMLLLLAGCAGRAAPAPPATGGASAHQARPDTRGAGAPLVIEAVEVSEARETIETVEAAEAAEAAEASEAVEAVESVGPGDAPDDGGPAIVSGGGRTNGAAPGAAPLTFEEELRAQFGGLFLDPVVDPPPAVTAQVREYVERFGGGPARNNFARWLTREGRYRDLILTELRDHDMPEGLLYLAMLESGFLPTAVSSARAVGLWQFIRSTGRAAGLRIDDWVDERRDPIAATRAALGHLRDLHDELDDWALAAAAYNAGLGRVRRARRGGGDDYFTLSAHRRLPRETRRYVPLILAAGHVALHRDRYGLQDVPADPPLAFDTLWVEGRTRLSAVARAADLPVETLKEFNPHLVRGAAPPELWPLRVPRDAIDAGAPARLAALPFEVRILPEYREIFWTVEPGDSWWRIARAHGRTVPAVRSLNPRLGEVIHPGDRILVERQLVTDGQLRRSRGS